LGLNESTLGLDGSVLGQSGSALDLNGPDLGLNGSSVKQPLSTSWCNEASRVLFVCRFVETHVRWFFICCPRNYINISGTALD
jgi:hypothetical protein